MVELNRAVAVSMAFGPEAGLALVDEIAATAALAGYRRFPRRGAIPAARRAAGRGAGGVRARGGADPQRTGGGVPARAGGGVRLRRLAGGGAGSAGLGEP